MDEIKVKRQAARAISPADKLCTLLEGDFDCVEHYSADEIEALPISDVEARLAELSIDHRQLVERCNNLMNLMPAANPISNADGTVNVGRAGGKTAESDRVIILIDQRPLMRSSISQFFEARLENASVVSLSCPNQLESALTEHGGQPSLVVYSVGSRQMPAQSFGNSIQCIRETISDVPVVVLSDSDERAQVLQALRCGVQGYVPTSLSPQVVVAAIRLVLAGGTYVPVGAIIEGAKELTPNKLEGRDGSSPWSELTPRQVEVLELLRLGKSNKFIAYELRMQESAVKVHIRQIMKKFHATNRTQAACIANVLHDDSNITEEVEPVLLELQASRQA